MTNQKEGYLIDPMTAFYAAVTAVRTARLGRSS